jgi:exonuclease SbcC
MRPLLLTITAFGPYATKQVIDFAELAGRNLFVITGDTGAGKTTILDAISYALYGKASGRDRDGDSLRSHFAHADLLTSVEMEFELRGERYWVQRIPKQRKKRTRGEGYTDQNPEAEFKNLVGETRVVSGVKEVNEKIVELLGLSYEQFKQIIMIPQGEFRELLNADSKARQDILQKIFGTEELRRVQELFEIQSKVLVQEVISLENQQKECIRSFDSSGYLPLAELLEQLDYNGNLVMDIAKEAIVWDVESSNALQLQIDEQEEQSFAKQVEIFQGKADNIKLTLREEAHQRKIGLEAVLPVVDEKKNKLEQARKTIGLLPVDEYQRNRAIHVEKKKVLLNQAIKQEQKLQVALIVAESKYQQEKEQDHKRDELVARQTQLSGLLEKVADLDARQTEMIGLEQVLHKTKKERDVIKEQLQQGREESIICQQRLDEAKDAIGEYAQKTVELEKIQDICVKFETLQVESACVMNLAQVGIQLQQQEAATLLVYEDAQKEYEKAQHLFLEGQAGLLASTLHAGESCPVCGSDHHPKLAVRMENILSEGELKTLHTKNKQAQEVYNAVRGKWERNQGDHYAQGQIITRLIKEVSLITADQLAELSPVELLTYSRDTILDYEKVKQGLQEKLDKAGKQKNIVGEIAATLRKKTEEISNFTMQSDELENQYTIVFAKVQSIKDAILKLEMEVPVAVRSLKTLTMEIQSIKGQLYTMQEALHNAEKERISTQVDYATAVAEKNGGEKSLEEGQAELRAAEEQFLAALLHAGFTTQLEYELAKLTTEEMATLAQEISNYQEELRSAVDAYGKAEAEVKGLIPVDVFALESQQQNIQEEKNILITKRTRIVARQMHNETMLRTICALVDRIEKTDQEHQLIGHLSKIAKGDNEQKISFERYVLAAFFNDIIDAANVRLKKMTGGRYQMSRITQKGKGSGQSGLEIEVFDYYTGQSRHVKTLSGGESFKASLALALGLAEVVQSYAGGISLDTMFVDEGFGTLDPESLDTAIGCLIDLQHSGRLVGIISHVPELKTSIDARLEIEACKDGSKAQFRIF